MPGPPTHVADVAVAEWIAPALAPFASNTVGALVPAGYATYARVGLPGWEPANRENGLPHEVLVALADDVGGGGAQSCLAAYWAGHGWVNGGGFIVAWVTDGAPVPDRAEREQIKAWASVPGFDASVLRGPKLRLPERAYVMLRGPLDSILAFGLTSPLRDFQYYTPDLLWPEDRSWFIATDTDLPSAYVGASAEHTAVILADPRISAVEMRYEDERPD